MLGRADSDEVPPLGRSRAHVVWTGQYRFHNIHRQLMSRMKSIPRDPPRPDATIDAFLRARLSELARTPPESIDPDAHFVRDLGVSSIDVLRLLAEVEDHFAISLPDSELASVTTLRRATERVIASLSDARP